jgi:hypothetical protein
VLGNTGAGLFNLNQRKKKFMAEFRETFLNDPQENIDLAKFSNSKFGLTLSPYDTPEQVLRAVLASKGVHTNEAETFGSLLLKILNRVS